MTDIATHLNISKNAVSLALNQKQGVSKELREQILKVAEELGYGEFAKNRKSARSILVMVPERIMGYEDNDHFLFYHDLIWGVERSIKERGVQPVIAKIDRSMEQNLTLPQLFDDIDFEGVILFGIVSENYARMVYQQGCPLVLFDSYYHDIHCPVVTSANFEGGYQAVKHLIENGHRSIGFIGPTNLTSSHEERYFGYWKAMQDHNLIPFDGLLRFKGYQENKQEIQKYVSQLKERPSAIFCGNDRMAILLMDVFREQNIRVPEDISIVGFDDLELAATANPRLTTIQVHKQEMCEAAIDMTLRTSDNKKHALIKWEVPGEFISRDSVKDVSR
ncbi:LacI family DNA-binding transcriptional regulator [Halobacillus seohaensis]